MSKRKILAELKKKNYYPINVEFERSSPTPSGYASGWDIEFNEDDSLEDKVYELNSDCEFSTYMEFDSLQLTLDWIKSLPVLAVKEYE